MNETTKSLNELFELAQTDPAALECYRQTEIRRILEQAPPYLRRRLQGLQFTIDAQRSRHATPLGACIQLTQMMFDSFTDLQRALEELTMIRNDTGGPTHEQPHSAEVIPLHPHIRR